MQHYFNKICVFLCFQIKGNLVETGLRPVSTTRPVSTDRPVSTAIDRAGCFSGLIILPASSFLFRYSLYLCSICTGTRRC